jgi:hypothetical protein
MAETLNDGLRLLCRGEDGIMEARKIELIGQMEAKGISVAQAAEKMEFDPRLLSLYLIKDGYPVPKRILDKLAEVIQN